MDREFEEIGLGARWDYEGLNISSSLWCRGDKRCAQRNLAPLPLPFREEDYFILVPLDQACKVLGLSCSITPNPKMAGGKGIRIVKPDAPNIVYRLFLGQPLVERLEGGKGQTETIAYAPYEEDGVVWVPFYWLAKQAGIIAWEVRNGKIYVAPKRRTQ